jgi:hypothetical protein
MLDLSKKSDIKKIESIKRQGDVGILILKAGNKLPTELTLKADVNQKSILALGEKTGHHHREEKKASRLYEDDMDGDTILEILEPTTIDHEEHRSIELDPAIASIVIQCQWDYSSSMVKKVVD